MAGTFALAELAEQARSAGAKLLLVGDPCQLSAVETGGAFGLLASSRPDTAHLDRGAPVHRTRRHPTDMGGTRRRRPTDGRRTPLPTEYVQRGRVHAGNRDAMTDAAYTAWLQDTRHGATSLLVAADSDTVRELNSEPGPISSLPAPSMTPAPSSCATGSPPVEVTASSPGKLTAS